MINVTRTYLPSFEEYSNKIRPLWESRWLTNRGEYVLELEKLLRSQLGLKHLLYVNNGMVALQVAIKALGITGDVITTPFSYVATTGAILWEGCTPVFVDIEPKTFCIDPDKIEQAITPSTTAIIATHVFGFSCDIEKIVTIAKRHNLKVIFDGAHSFMSSYKGQSVLSYGDISICSFHATKLFHTVEGGAIVCNDDSLIEKVLLFHQFGHLYDDYKDMGINAKASELHAAMGLCLLPYMDSIIGIRKELYEKYRFELKDLSIQFPEPDTWEGYNYAYFPVIFNDEAAALRIKASLAHDNIMCRRYFHPSLNTLPYVEYMACPISENIASRILCLPFFPELSDSELQTICSLIKTHL